MTLLLIISGCPGGPGGLGGPGGPGGPEGPGGYEAQVGVKAKSIIPR